MKKLLLGLVLLTAGIACAGNGVPKSGPSVTQSGTPRSRVEILDADLAWVHDSIPVVRFNVPFIYGMWRLQVESCSGRTRDGWPKFYIAPVSPIPGRPGRRPQFAFYAEESKSIVFALGNETAQPVVMHELLHFLLAPIIPLATRPETEEEQIARTHPVVYFGDDSIPGACSHLLVAKS